MNKIKRCKTDAFAGFVYWNLFSFLFYVVSYFFIILMFNILFNCICFLWQSSSYAAFTNSSLFFKFGFLAIALLVGM